MEDFVLVEALVPYKVKRPIVFSRKEDAMKLFAIRRPMGWKTPEDLGEAAKLSARVGDEEMSGDIRWIRSYVVIEADGSLGTICIYEASSPEKIREHAERAGLPATEIWEVADTVIVRQDPVAAAA
jgi:hypothetical protein